MLHEIGVELAAQLAQRNAPFTVIDGPEIRGTATFARERVVIEHDEQDGDTVGNPHAVGKNPPMRFSRVMGAKIRIYAKSPSSGPIYWEHVRRAEAVLDLVLVGLYNIKSSRQNLLSIRSGKFFVPPDLAESETRGGAAYELAFGFDRAVTDHQWSGQIGLYTTICPQMLGGPALTFAATGSTITRSFGSWLTDGFAVGNLVTVTGSTSNNGIVGRITTLTAAVMTVSGSLVNEGPDSGVSILGTLAPFMIGNPAVTFNAAQHTIVRAAGSWILDGFVVGMPIQVFGSAHNNGSIGQITALNDQTMGFASGLTQEGPLSGVTVAASGAAINTVANANGETIVPNIPS
jgi:hypothetical protein